MLQVCIDNNNKISYLDRMLLSPEGAFQRGPEGIIIIIIIIMII